MCETEARTEMKPLQESLMRHEKTQDLFLYQIRTTPYSNIHLWKSKISIRVQRNHTFEGITSVRTRTGSAQNIPKERNKSLVNLFWFQS